MFAPLRPKLAGWQSLTRRARVFDAVVSASRGKVSFGMGPAEFEESQRSVSSEGSEVQSRENQLWCHG
jgi:hypothetical protein